MNNKLANKYYSVYLAIGNNVKRFRTEKGLTQQQLSDKCDGVTRAKISKIENAYEDYMMSTLLEVGNALGKSLKEIAEE